jgi:hypothetical protein
MCEMLFRHIDYVAATDPLFEGSWATRGPRCVPLLAEVERGAGCLHRQSIHWQHAHVRATRDGAQICGVPDFEFGVAPRPNLWIARCMPAKASRLFEHWSRRLNRYLRSACSVPCTLYGGIKSPAGIWRRIQQWSRGADFDLWDGVRFRVVVAGIREMTAIAWLLFHEFRNRIVRCRNYYARPRHGPMDPYRAVHLELQSDDEDFLEIQLVSARREAVGLIDHSVVLKRRVPLVSSLHEAWLRRLSWTANLLDWRDASGVSGIGDPSERR